MILCKLGLHRWKPVMARARQHGIDFLNMGFGFVAMPVFAGQWLTVGYRCRCCGKRRPR